ncbi:hypothetical protein [Arthrobacter sp.]|uniref:hypothetical protein n=1 Tax=Arthrobacter sp. TaxID=1667 RepID=UPI002811A533|nr:hypothetical protein [Arthrobacter sp.]
MALGRHRAEIPAREIDGSGGSDVVVWGGFVTLSAGVTMAVFELSVLTIAFVTAALAGGFLLVSWLAASVSRPAPDSSGTPQEPAPPITPTASETLPWPKAEKAPVEAVEPDSRWIDTFGPPETGQLPVQRYLRDNGPANRQRAEDSDSTLPQWSHSRA